MNMIKNPTGFWDPSWYGWTQDYVGFSWCFTCPVSLGLTFFFPAVQENLRLRWKTTCNHSNGSKCKDPQGGFCTRFNVFLYIYYCSVNAWCLLKFMKYPTSLTKVFAAHKETNKWVGIFGIFGSFLLHFTIDGIFEVQRSSSADSGRLGRSLL